MAIIITITQHFFIKQLKVHLRMIILLFLTFSINAFSQQIVSLSIQQAIDSAMANNQKIKQYHEAVNRKEYIKQAATGRPEKVVEVLTN